MYFDLMNQVTTLAAQVRLLLYFVFAVKLFFIVF